MVLTDLHRSILEFERIARWRSLGRKDEAILDLFDLSTVRYHQVLEWILDQPEALAYDPPTVNRLRRLRDRRKAARAGR